MRLFLVCGSLLLSFALIQGNGLLADGPPATPRRPVTQAYHGFTVTEDYRWLEDGHDPAVRDWSAAQNKYARSILDHLPQVAEIRQEVTQILSRQTPSYFDLVEAGGRLFALQHQPPREQSFLIVSPSWESLERSRIVLDPVDLEAAWRIAEAFADQTFSFTDCTSFAIMERLGVADAFAFDRHFLIYRFGPRRDRAFHCWPG